MTSDCSKTITLPCTKCGQLITVPVQDQDQDKEVLSIHHLICPTQPHLFQLPTQKHTQLALTIKDPRRN